MRVAYSAWIRRALLGTALSCAGMVYTPKIWATDDSALSVAREHNRRGETQYAVGQYAEALVEYQAGFDSVPLPGFLINMAQCHRRLGDLPKARVTYEKFVLVAPDSPLIGEVRGQIAEIERQLRDDGRAEMSAANKPAATSAPRGTGDSATGPSKASAGPGTTAVSPARFLPQQPPSTIGATAPGTNLAVAPVVSPTNHRRWWLWGSITTAVVAGTVATYVALASPDGTILHEGTLGSLRR